MKELDLLKKDWQNRQEDDAKLSYNDIYKMVLKKSSSVVKWIFYISIIEFLFWHLLHFIPNTSLEVYESLGLMPLLYTTSIIHYLISFGFIYVFYKNFKNISNTDTTKRLMENIIYVRKIVRNYVIYNLGMFTIVYGIINWIMYKKKEVLFTLEPFKSQIENTPDFENFIFISLVISGIIVVLATGAIYFLLYGLMLKKLKRNYNELKKLEM